MTEDKMEQNGKTILAIISLGLAAAGIATIIQLATLSKLDCSLSVTIYGFSIAIPMLVTSGLAVHPSFEINLGQIKSKALLTIIYVVGILASVIAVGGLFFHFSKSAGIAFGVASFVCVVLARKIETIH